jgi:hypothetical protein
LACSFSGCKKEEASPEPRKPPIAVPRATPSTEGEEKESRPAAPEAKNTEFEGETSPTPEPRIWGRADLDPANDHVVAPPDEVPDCHARLTALGIKFRPAHLPLKQVVRDIPTCGCHDAVTVSETPQGMKLVPAAVLTCQMALSLASLEIAIQELAERHLMQKVRTLHQGGTYSCRKMARFDLVSEHSYGNAIDVFAFTLENGQKVSVKSDFGRLDAATETLPATAKFLRDLSSAVYDRDLMSVSLSPYWDSLHHDHFHFDMARYRVDGSRPH